MSAFGVMHRRWHALHQHAQVLSFASRLRERRMLRGAFEAWQRELSQRRLRETQASQQHQLVQQMQSMQTWQQTTARLLMGRALRRLMYGRLRDAFHRWHGQLSLHHRRRHLVHTVLNRARVRMLTQGWSRWIHVVQRQHDAQNSSAIAALLASQRQMAVETKEKALQARLRLIFAREGDLERRVFSAVRFKHL
jgi:hypothetical protein